MIEKVKEYKWLVTPDSDRKRRYAVIHKTDDTYNCDCKGYKYHGHCKHIEEVKNEQNDIVLEA